MFFVALKLENILNYNERRETSPRSNFKNQKLLYWIGLEKLT